MIVKHTILDPQTNEPLTEVILNLEAVNHAKMNPEGDVFISMANGVSYDSTSANKDSAFWARLFWLYLNEQCKPIIQKPVTSKGVSNEEVYKKDRQANKKS